MKKIYLLLIILVTINAKQSQAQTYTFNWGSSFSSAWVAGSSTTHTSNTIGTSGITATVSFSSPEAGAMSSFAGFTSPQVSSGGSPFTSQLGSNTPNLALGMDLASNANYVDVTITFSAAITNVVFNIADIDKSANNSSTYYDEVLVTGTNGAIAVTNPTLSKINGTAINTTTDTLIISGNIAHSNTINGRGGNTPSNTADQNGTVKVDFGSVALTSITVRYRNTTGAQANPAQQAIAIGNIDFQKNVTLPVILNSFAGAEENGKIGLTWTTAQEINSSEFIVEKSTDGINWCSIATVTATGNSSIAVTYHATDDQPAAINYYRLKQVDMDGAYVYSKVLKIAGKENNTFSVKVFPNPVTSSATLSVNSKENKTVNIKVYNNSGMLMKEMKRQLSIGTNNIDIPSVNTLANGMYTVMMDNSAAQFVKQ